MVGNREERSFGLLPHVKIQAVDGKHVSFATRSESRSGDAKESLLRTFTVPRTEIYTAPIPGAPASVKLQPGALGPLYLSRKGWDTTTSDGFGIYGARLASIKFPQSAAMGAPPLTRLTVVPTSIRIHGHLEGEKSFFDLEVLGPDAAGSQEILWNGADYVELRLTEHGVRRLRVKPPSRVVRVWPIQIVVEGAPAIEPTIAGKVDILDGEKAGTMQRLVFVKHGAPVSLELTEDGIEEFHVSPQEVAEQAADAGPGPAAKRRGHSARA